eukprot:CAMPEP_0180200186 /NCGR_PEP_ID=MMETSP0987-20121128/6105_1 /TAXON_ID=697907 /ORGANISM="non described non described, Strain CCMP2293" /LENGTH=240 /DNA_ID=CAMNT_0022155315 /DNA_START=103 /DNA_END=822 /DNA_ORIENTATION=-
MTESHGGSFDFSVEVDQLEHSAPMRTLPATFQARQATPTFKAALYINAVLTGLIPLTVFLVWPLPKDTAEQGAYWKDSIFLLFIAGLGLATAFLLIPIRTPVRYCVSRSKLTVVSHARTTWWWAPCYYLCLPSSYSIRLQDVLSAEDRVAPCIPPPIILPPPRTASSGHLCCVRFMHRPFGIFSSIQWSETVWLSPQEPRELARLLAWAKSEVDSGRLLPDDLPAVREPYKPPEYRNSDA